MTKFDDHIVTVQKELTALTDEFLDADMQTEGVHILNNSKMQFTLLIIEKLEWIAIQTLKACDVKVPEYMYTTAFNAVCCCLINNVACSTPGGKDV